MVPASILLMLGIPWALLGIAMIIAFIFWWMMWLKVVGPDEMAWKVVFGEAVQYVQSGLTMVPRLPRCYLVRYPTTISEIVCPEINVITKPGKYKGISYDSVSVRITLVVYIQLPRTGENLLQLLKSKIYEDEEKFKEFVSNTVLGSARTALTGHTWGQINSDLETMRKETEKLLTEGDSGFLKVGFKEKDISLTIKEFHLPQSLESLLSLPDEERIKVKVAETQAEIKAKKSIGTMIHMMSEYTGKSLEDVKEDIKKDPALNKKFREFSEKLVNKGVAIEGGSYFEFSADGSQGLEKTVLNWIALASRMLERGRSPSMQSDTQKKPKQTVKAMIGGKERVVPHTAK